MKSADYWKNIQHYVTVISLFLLVQSYVASSQKCQDFHCYKQCRGWCHKPQSFYDCCSMYIHNGKRSQKRSSTDNRAQLLERITQYIQLSNSDYEDYYYPDEYVEYYNAIGFR